MGIRWLIILLLAGNLYGFTISLKPGSNYWGTAKALTGEAPRIWSFHLGLETGFNVMSFMSMHCGCAYSDREWTPEGVGLHPVDLPELFAYYSNRFTIPQKIILPYFTLGFLWKFGFYNFSTIEKTTFNITIGHGYTIKIGNHFSIDPEIVVPFQVAPEADLPGFLINVGLSYHL